MKKIKKLVQGTLGLLALGTVAGHAQEVQTVEIEGTVGSWWNYWNEGVDPDLANAATFKFVVEQDISAPTDYLYDPQYYTEKGYRDNIYSMSFTFYDAEGVEIESSVTTEIPAGEFDYSYVWARDNKESAEYAQYMQWWGEDYSDERENNAYLGAYVFNGNLQNELFSDFTGYPVLMELQEQPLNFYGWMQSDLFTYGYQEFWGTVTSIRSFYPDDDEDGYPNNVDSCVTSDMAETVMFDGWFDSGVTNYVDSSGCTVTDHYAACDAEEEPERGIRSTRSGPSNCEKAVSYDLVADGVISYTEARMLRNALYTVN